MRLRKGFYRIASRRLARGDAGWLLRQAKKYLRIRQGIRRGDGRALAGPVIAHLFSTTRCDSRCVMCDLPRRPAGDEFSTGEFRRLLGQLQELGVSGISFTGGEPTLREDIHELLELSRGADLDTILVTNALTLDRHVEKIVELKLGTVNVSLDSAEAAVHDRIRGVPGAFQRTTENVKRLLERVRSSGSRTDLVISTVLGPLNCGREAIGALIEYVSGLGAGGIVFCPVHDFDYRNQTVGIGRMELDYDLSSYLLAHPRRKLIDNSDWYLSRLTEVIKSGKPPAGCVAGYTTLFLDWELKVYPCKAYLEINKPLFSFRDSDATLEEMWFSESFNDFRRFCRGCRKCFLSVNREFDAVFR